MVPPHDEQVQIASRLESERAAAEQMRKALHDRLVSINQLRSALLNDAFSGRTKVVYQVRESRSLPHGIVFKRGAIAAYIIDGLHRRPTFGRVQLEKGIYLTEAYVGVDLAGRYQRKAAGPYDSDSLYNLESLAWKRGWFSKHARGAEGFFYRPGKEIDDRLGAAVTLLGERKQAMDHLLRLLGKLDTEQAEVVTTLFAAWNDFLIDGRHPSDEEVIREVRENWQETKKRFSDGRLQAALSWMRENDLTPNGIGPHTEIDYGK